MRGGTGGDGFDWSVYRTKKPGCKARRDSSQPFSWSDEKGSGLAKGKPHEYGRRSSPQSHRLEKYQRPESSCSFPCPFRESLLGLQRLTVTERFADLCISVAVAGDAGITGCPSSGSRKLPWRSRRDRRPTRRTLSRDRPTPGIGHFLGRHFLPLVLPSEKHVNKPDISPGYALPSMYCTRTRTAGSSGILLFRQRLTRSTVQGRVAASTSSLPKAMARASHWAADLRGRVTLTPVIHFRCLLHRASSLSFTSRKENFSFLSPSPQVPYLLPSKSGLTSSRLVSDIVCTPRRYRIDLLA